MELVREVNVITGEETFVEQDIPQQNYVEPVPSTISDRQFFEQLANIGKISEEDALAAVSIGAIPPAISTFVDALPPAERFKALMLLKGATTFERNHPVVPIFGLFFNMTSEEVDQLWRDASVL